MFLLTLEESYTPWSCTPSRPLCWLSVPASPRSAQHTDDRYTLILILDVFINSIVVFILLCFISNYMLLYVCIHSVTFLNFLALQVISYLVSAAASDLDGVIDDLRLSADKALLDVVQGRLDVLRLKLGETLIIRLYLTPLTLQLFLSTLPKVLSRYMYIWRSPKKDRSNKAKLIRAYV